MKVRLDYVAIGRVLDSAADADTPVPAIYRHPAIGATEAEFANARAARGALSAKIASAFYRLDLVEKLGSEAAVKRRFEALGKLLKAAKVIEESFSSESMSFAALQKNLVDDSIWLSVDLSDFAELKRAVENERRRMKLNQLDAAAPLKAMKDLGQSNQPALIASLGQIYSHAFRVDPRIEYDTSRDSDGPFLRFAEAVLFETGNPTKRETIRRYWHRSQVSDKGTEKS